MKSQKEGSSVKKVNCADTNLDENSSYDSCGLTTVTTNVSAEVKTSWILDSGATRHMCSDKNKFSALVKLNNPIKVQVGDGRQLTARAIGRVTIEVNLSNNSDQVNLTNVLYVPELAYNLISVPQLSKNGNKTVFAGNIVNVFSEGNKLIAVGSKKNDLYYLNAINDSGKNAVNSLLVTNSNDNLWHKRFCHLNNQGMKKLLTENLVEGLNVNSFEKPIFCESCVYGKQHKIPFPKQSMRKSTAPLQLIHSDVCGKMSSKSLSGNEYFITFIDDYSRHVWVYPIKTKDQALSKFKDFRLLVENKFDCKIKQLRSDNGGEYTSHEFENYLKSNGIAHQKTIVKNPQQNGVSERMNRSLVEAVRTMLHDSQLPKNFWAEALSTAVHLRNRCPSSALNKQTPYEALKNRKPNVSYLRTFGSIAYAHVCKEDRFKVDVKSKKCVLLGYGNKIKGYRLYDIDKKQVFFSRDVIFNESERMNSQKENSFPQSTNDHSMCETMLEKHEENDNSNSNVPERPPRIRKSPDHFGDWIFVSHDFTTEPQTFQEAINSNDAALWREAMQSEIESIDSNNVWELVDLPENRNALKCKWVFKQKTDSNGKIIKYKARLVAKGFSQKYSIDYTETFSPVVHFSSVRSLLALAAQRDLHVCQLDVSTAFLNGELEEDVYMMQPEGFIAKNNEHKVCKLKKSIYGLKQSSKCWITTLNNFLIQMNFSQSESDPCVYVNNDNELFIIAVYVDDIILISK